MPTGICRDFIAGAQFPTVRRTLVSNCPCRTGALYAATKYAIEGYSESLDHELRTKGIRACVNTPEDVLFPGGQERGIGARVARRQGLKRSRSPGSVFTLPRTVCSPSRGSRVHDGVEYALQGGARNVDFVSARGTASAAPASLSQGRQRSNGAAPNGSASGQLALPGRQGLTCQRRPAVGSSGETSTVRCSYS